MWAQHGGEWSGGSHVWRAQHAGCAANSTDARHPAHTLLRGGGGGNRASSTGECAIAGRAQSSCKGPATKTPMVISGSSAIKCPRFACFLSVTCVPRSPPDATPAASGPRAPAVRAP
jgi:hypothetical protein